MRWAVVWQREMLFTIPPSLLTLPSYQLPILSSFPPSASLFTQELEKARWFNEKLGTGIAFFQALSNLAINGEERNIGARLAGWKQENLMTLRLFLSRYSPGSGVAWWVALSDQSDYSWGPHVFLGSHSNHSKVHKYCRTFSSPSLSPSHCLPSSLPFFPQVHGGSLHLVWSGGPRYKCWSKSI